MRVIPQRPVFFGVNDPNNAEGFVAVPCMLRDPGRKNVIKRSEISSEPWIAQRDRARREIPPPGRPSSKTIATIAAAYTNDLHGLWKLRSIPTA